MPTLLITGANRGIGLEFVKQYAVAGWHVLACCRTPSTAGKLQTLADLSQNRVSLHALDVANFPGIDALARQLRETPIDLLINNAGIYPDRGSFGQTDYEAWAMSFRINSMATLKMAEAFVGHLERGTGKTFVGISSKMGSIADNTSGGSYPYRTSKAAMGMVIKSLAHELASRSIRAVVLHPGWVLTDMGGPNALITVEQSVSGMRQVLEGLSTADSGRFLAYDGKEVPW
jgi:NAD(P)-dependent dehydrogenase (short-subunit alcohol dehydrogenase family)